MDHDAGQVRVWPQPGYLLIVLPHRIGNTLDANNIRFDRLDGSMTLKQREAALEMFGNDLGCEVFLMSLKAGGLGLNLTAAQRVFLMDPHWHVLSF